MKGLALAWLSIVSVMLAGAEVSHAQVGYTQPSIEWLIADSDVVVRASVVSVSREPARKQDSWVWRTVTVDVHETLKGRHSKRLEFAVYGSPMMDVFEQLKTSGPKVLCCLVRGERHPHNKREDSGDEGPGTAMLEPLEVTPLVWVDSLIRLGSPVAEQRMPPPIFTVDLRLLEEPEEVLRAARIAAAEEGEAERAGNHYVVLPREVMEATGRSGDINRLKVPVDQRLEAAARRWIEAPEAIPKRLGIVRGRDDRTLKSYANRFQLEGVRALRNFRSDENAVILTRLLDDDASSHQITKEEARAGITEKVDHVRKEAFDTLREWGVEVNEAVLKEQLPPR